ncbi:MAG: cytochrome d ubiquinol oxidase subunit II, partial [Hydrogenovibrio sp.]
GVLYPWFDGDEERDTVMRSISHVWDGNETWLVFGGVVLFAAFPFVYSHLLPSLYVPLILMLMGLILRGVAFEYRFKAVRSKRVWDAAFFGGSTLAAMCQGMVLGAVVQGGRMEGELFVLDWFSPFTIFTGVSVVAAYALLASCYLVLKTRGALLVRAARLGRRLVIVMMVSLVVVSLWMLYSNEWVRTRWLEGLNAFYLLPMPVLSALFGWWLYRSLNGEECGAKPFWLTVGLFVLGFIGLVVGLFPYLMPHQFTLWEVHAPEASLWFALPGVLIFLPLVLAYTLWGYRIFSGKVEDFEEGY